MAIDGTKIGSDAALDMNRSATWIRAEIDKILAEAATTDAAVPGRGFEGGREGSGRGILWPQAPQAETHGPHAALVRAEADLGDPRVDGLTVKNPRHGSCRLVIKRDPAWARV